jgi:hypothetical protein
MKPRNSNRTGGDCGPAGGCCDRAAAPPHAAVSSVQANACTHHAWALCLLPLQCDAPLAALRSQLTDLQSKLAAAESSGGSCTQEAAGLREEAAALKEKLQQVVCCKGGMFHCPWRCLQGRKGAQQRAALVAPASPPPVSHSPACNPPNHVLPPPWLSLQAEASLASSAAASQGLSAQLEEAKAALAAAPDAASIEQERQRLQVRGPPPLSLSWGLKTGALSPVLQAVMRFSSIPAVSAHLRWPPEAVASTLTPHALPCPLGAGRRRGRRGTRGRGGRQAGGGGG